VDRTRLVTSSTIKAIAKFIRVESEPDVYVYLSVSPIDRPASPPFRQRFISTVQLSFLYPLFRLRTRNAIFKSLPARSTELFPLMRPANVESFPVVCAPTSP